MSEVQTLHQVSHSWHSHCNDMEINQSCFTFQVCAHVTSIYTKSRGREVNTPASYSWGPGFKSRTRKCFSDWCVRGFPQSLYKMPEWRLKLGQNRLLTRPHHIIQLSTFRLTQYILSDWKASLNKQQIHKHGFTPNVAVEWSEFPLSIREVPYSHIGQETSYHNWGFGVFPESVQK
jgi:hypothetical protein